LWRRLENIRGVKGDYQCSPDIENNVECLADLIPRRAKGTIKAQLITPSPPPKKKKKKKRRRRKF
jgi:hypothetical protein